MTNNIAFSEVPGSDNGSESIRRFAQSECKVFDQECIIKEELPDMLPEHDEQFTYMYEMSNEDSVTEKGTLLMMPQSDKSSDAAHEIDMDCRVVLTRLDCESLLTQREVSASGNLKRKTQEPNSTARMNRKTKKIIHTKLLECKQCGKYYPTLIGLKRHVLINHTDKCFNCKECRKSYSSMFALKRHISRSHTDEKRVLCKQCGTTYSCLFTLNRHISVIHKNSKLSQTHASCRGKCSYCNKCGINFSSEIVLKRHVSIIHKSSKLSKLPSNGNVNDHNKVCGNGFFQKKCLKLHTKVVHLPVHIKPHKCFKCGKRFSRRYSMRRHIKQNHHFRNEAEISLKTSKPSKGVSQKESDNKMSTSGAKNTIDDKLIKPSKCNECGKGFTLNFGLKMHISKFHSEKKSSLPNPINNLGLKVHSTRVHIYAENKPSKSQNESDNMTSKSGPDMMIRQNNNSESKLPKPFQCNKCGKCFTLNIGLKLHMTKVHAENQLFKSESERKLPKPFQCKKCGKCFTTDHGLNVHIAKVHMYAVQNKPSKSQNESDNMNYKSGSDIMISQIKDNNSENKFLKPFQCKKCGKCFTLNMGLKLHMTKVHAENQPSRSVSERKLPKPFQCKKCGKYFTTDHGCNIHISMVHKYAVQNKPFKSQNESENMNSKSGSDMMISQNNNSESKLPKPFQCNKCGKCFTLNIGLKLHMTKVHAENEPSRNEPHNKSENVDSENNEKSSSFADSDTENEYFVSQAKLSSNEERHDTCSENGSPSCYNNTDGQGENEWDTDSENEESLGHFKWNCGRSSLEPKDMERHDRLMDLFLKLL